MGPFDRFNDRAKRVVALAQDEAIRFSHDHIGTEHLLLGLVREGEGVAARALDVLGVELPAVRAHVEAKVGRGDANTTASRIVLHPLTKRVFDLAIDEARLLGHGHVGTEHLLLGLVRLREGPASDVLRELGVDLERLRVQIVVMLHAKRVDAGPVTYTDAAGQKRDWYCEDVLSGKLAVRVVHDDERVLAFEHPDPQYVVHAVVIPKAHVPSLLDAAALDAELLRAMLAAVQQVARKLGLDQHGFQVQTNAAAPGVTPHMHWHVVGPGLPPPRRGATEWVHRSAGPARRVGAGVAAPPTVTAAMSGGGPFDRFDDRAKRVLAFAQEEAIRHQHNYIGTEHLLMGLLLCGDPVVDGALEGIAVDKARTALEFIIGRGDAATAASDITLSPRTKRTFELGIDEARRHGSSTVTPAFVLLGLAREGQGIASGILESLGLTMDEIERRVEQRLGGT